MPEFGLLGKAGLDLFQNLVHDPHLISLWLENEKSGTNLIDRCTKNRLDLTITGTPAAFGKKMATPANAGQFTAVNSEYLSIADNASLSMGTGVQFSIAAWCYMDSLVANGTICGKWTTAGNQKEYLLRYFNADQRFNFYVSPDGITQTIVSANALGAPSTRTWYLLIAIYDGANLRISANNGTETTAAYTGDAFNGTAAFEIGAVEGASGLFDGRIGPVSLWKRALTTAEKTWLYNNRMGRAYSESLGTTLRDGLISWWNLDEASGNRADSHGSNILTDNNTVTANPGVTRAAQARLWGIEWNTLAANQYADGGNASAFDFEWSNPFSLLGIVTPDWSGSITIISKYNSAITRGWTWQIDGTGKPEIFMPTAAAGNSIDVIANAGLTRHNTYMLGMSYDGLGLAPGITLYKNGATDADTDSADTLAYRTIKNAKPVQIAAADSATNFRGDISLVAAFSAAKTAEDFRRWAYLAGFL